MKKSLLLALSAGALGYLAYTSGIFAKVLKKTRRAVPDLERRSAIEQPRLDKERRPRRRRQASHRTAEGLLDLNSASQQELESLSGIESGLAERIIENRPYLTKIDLVGRMVVPDLVYEEIKHYVTVRPHAA